LLLEIMESSKALLAVNVENEHSRLRPGCYSPITLRKLLQPVTKAHVIARRLVRPVTNQWLFVAGLHWKQPPAAHRQPPDRCYTVLDNHFRTLLWACRRGPFRFAAVITAAPQAQYFRG
jgi:hypothetical protein